MNDGVSILVAVFLILFALRWMLGGAQPSIGQQGQRRPTSRRMQHRVTPQMVEMVRAMFPDIPIPAIVADLQRTGSVETTVDNALRDGGLPLWVNMRRQPSVPSSSGSSTPGANGGDSGSSTGASTKSASHLNLMQRYKLDTKDVDSEALAEPPKVWESSPEKREEMLRKRKEFMVLQARKKLQEQQQKAKAEANANKGNEHNNGSSEGSRLAADSGEKSVEEVKSVAPEQISQHMLQA
ncbi:uncharacterized protein BYT42DRAFT_548237 [Radiomyces spectabilis]|uniref:uncharacterized protein n=1 Tax=Radiomyces spectabilis TaxID=64574 RepID=UPI00221EB803|nr:uncharacterized protein BYT42DRAFT_548237 [Radiomyces spectabilis]KAI8371353.1 hypothetical protein BYT42DRAFT_548237 [Radiomyces spectabilis]